MPKKRKLKTDEQFSESIRCLAGFCRNHVGTMRKRKVKKKDRQLLLGQIDYMLKSIIASMEQFEKGLKEDEVQTSPKPVPRID